MDIDELVAQSRPGVVRKCWRMRLDGQAAEYMTAIEKLPREQIVGSKVWHILNNTFGVDIGVHRVREHLAGKCNCTRG